MTYLKYKYEKYKTKYLNLKHKLQKGGNFNKINPDGTTKIILLRSELSYLTKCIYVENVFVNIIKKYIPFGIIIKETSSAEYCQDPYIFLNDNNGENYSIHISNINYDSILDVPSENKFELTSTNHNDLGGNFISSPSYDTINGNIYAVTGMTVALEKFLNTVVDQKIIKLNCGFTYKNERHIDELMCFMPYDKTFKVWIYSIGEVLYNNELIEKLKNYENIVNNPNNFKDYENKLMISFNEQIEKLKNQYSDQSQTSKINILNELLSVNTSFEEKIKNIYENKSRYNFVMNRLNDLYIKILFYYDILYRKFDKFVNINKFTNDLIIECNNNIQQISDSLNDGIEIVTFPISIEMDESGSGKIIDPPLFNRLYIETEENAICLFPEQTGKFASKNLALIESEFKSIKSFSGKIVTYKFINTQKYHTSSKGIGGNLHCLVKQLLSTSIKSQITYLGKRKFEGENKNTSEKFKKI